MGTKIICLGNELVGDDGIGVRVARVLGSLDLPSQVSVSYRGSDLFALLDELGEADDFVFVDAINTGQAPGQFRVYSFAGVRLLAQSPHAAHALGLSEVVAIAEQLHGAGLAERVCLVGVEARPALEYTTVLSPPLQQALPAVVLRVLDMVGADEVLLAAGEQLAKHWAYEDISPVDLPVMR